MGVYIDTVAGWLTAGLTNPKALAPVNVATGDSLQVRSFSAQGYAKLEAIFFKGTAKTQVRVESPMFHDDVLGITFGPAESPALELLPQYVGQPLITGDTLTLESGCAASSSSITALSHYYSDPNGPVSRLHSWGDISGIIKSVKTMEVDVAASAVIGTWSDTVINTVDKQLHAHTDYAVLGYETDTALACIGFKGQMTQNLRVCGPGAATTVDISDWFVKMSERHQTPHIPVFNADNQGATYVSVLDNAASTAAKVYVILAELANTITP